MHVVVAELIEALHHLENKLKGPADPRLNRNVREGTFLIHNNARSLREYMLV